MRAAFAVTENRLLRYFAADAGVDQRRFLARVGADEQQGVAVLEPEDGGVEQIGLAGPAADLCPVLAASSPATCRTRSR